ncbi:MAG: hypothetical protein ACJ75J_03945 [Cytophagaceae bacterium]
MKYIYTLACILSLGIYTAAKAQDATETDYTTASSATSYNKADTLSGMGSTSIVNTAEYHGTGTCTLIQNTGTNRKMTNKKHGYKIVTANKMEKVNVTTGKNGARKIKYYGETEGLKYHKDSKGKIHYKYTYYDDCRKILVKRNKKGITTTNHKSSLNPEEINQKVTAAINTGVNTCSITD